MNRLSANYDVIIVGAGPSGAILSYVLAQNGVNVLLLEKEKLPRYKACGGGVNLRTTSLIPFDITEVVENTIYGAMLSHKSSSPVLRTYPEPLTYMVMRDKLDHLLSCQAQAAGAQIIDQCKVTNMEIQKDRVVVQTTMSTYTASIIVGADGANGVVARSSGLARRGQRGMAIDCQLIVDDRSLAKWDGTVSIEFGGVYGGYSWIFPKRDCLSVGIGGPDRYAKHMKSYLLHFIEKQRFSSYKVKRFRGHALPHGYNDAHLTASRSLLVGDAAGLIDPLTGDGIYYSIKSAVLAAPVIMKTLEANRTVLAEYEKAVKTELVPELQAGRILARLAGRFAQAYVKLLVTNDKVWDFFCHTLRGQATYASLKQKLGPLGLIFQFL